MSDDPLSRLLDGRFPDPDGPGMLVPPIRDVVIADSLAGAEAALVGRLGFGHRLGVVSDPRTRAALGARVEAGLTPGHAVIRVVLEDGPHPNEATAARVQAQAAGCDALVAVGSGTLNDLTKVAAHRLGVPFAVFATAPSMNGYTSVSAAITVGGLKTSLRAAVAAGVFLDLGVLAAAPPRLIRAGFGDSAARATAQVDWLMAHRLRRTPYRRAPFALLAEDEAGLFADPGALLAGGTASMARLARTLVLSGFGMTLCGGSYPASQGEHLLSHFIEMMAPPGTEHALHGEQVAVTTLAMAGLQERMLAAPPPRLRATTADAASLAARFGPTLGAACWAEFARKRLGAAEAEALTRRAAAEWPSLRAELVAVGRPEAALRAAFNAIGAPTSPAAIGVAPALARDAMLHAREIRDRFTFLDLADDAGLLEAEAERWSR